MDLLRLGLERGKTAYEAMHVMIDLLEKYGQSGDCEHAGEWGKANYHNSYILADPQEAWVLETAGRYWAAKRTKNGVYSISNIYSIERDWDEAHPKLVEHAIQMGWSKSAKDFNFARDYGDYWRAESKNPGAMQIRRNMTMACLRKDFSHVIPASMMQVSRSHLEGTVAEPRWGAGRNVLAHPLYARQRTFQLPFGGVFRGPLAGGTASPAAPSLLGEFLQSVLQRLQAVLPARPHRSGVLFRRHQRLLWRVALVVGQPRETALRSEPQRVGADRARGLRSG